MASRMCHFTGWNAIPGPQVVINRDEKKETRQHTQFQLEVRHIRYRKPGKNSILVSGSRS